MLSPQSKTQSAKTLNLSAITKEAEFTEQDYIRFRDLVRRNSGIYFNEKKRNDLKLGVLKAFHYSGHPNLNSYYNALTGDSQNVTLFKTLVSFLTVGETYFFRHFDVIEKQILPRLIKAHQHDKSLRIWSAGCSTGEEPYTIAMVLDHLLPDLAEWKIFILGTDININSLDYAREALYRPWSLRTINDYYKNRYFTKKEGLYYLIPSIQSMVQFDYLNLVEDCYPSPANNTTDMDIIFCRNVTIYFEAETTIKVINRFYKSLKEKSYLAVGHAEPSSLIYDQYIGEIFPDAVVYRKDTAAKKEMQYKTGIKTREDLFSSHRKQASITGSSQVTSTLAELQKQIDKLSINGETQKKVSAVSKSEAEKKTETIGKTIPAVTPTPEKTPVTIPVKVKETIRTEEDLRRAEATEFQMFAEGIEQFKNKQFEESLKTFKSINELYPNNGRALYMTAHICANLDRIEEAKDYCYKAIQKDSLLIEAYYLLGLIYKEENAFDDSIKMLKKAIYINMNFAIGYYEIAVNYFKLGDQVQGRKYLKQTEKILKTIPPDERLGVLDDLSARELGMMVKMWDT